MKSERLELRLDPELLARVDAVRGDVPRAAFVRRALKHAVELYEAPLRASDPLQPKPVVRSSSPSLDRFRS